MDKEDVVLCTCYMFTTEYYSSKKIKNKKNKIMSSAATWMDLVIVILSEVNQTKTNIT